MSPQSYSFKSNADDKFLLEDSKELFIIRFSENVIPMAILESIPALLPLLNHVGLFLSLPDSNAHLFKIINSVEPDKIREDIKAIFRASMPGTALYIGTVLQFAVTGIYQIYTGNM